MTYQKALQTSMPCLAAILICGCVTTTTKNGHQIANEPSRISRQFSRFKSSVTGLVESVTPKDQADPIRWDWAAGIPQSMLKGESIPVNVPDSAVAFFAPDANLSKIRLVNGDSEVPLSIGVVNDTRIRTLADLDMAVQNAVGDSGETGPVVEFAGGLAGASSVPAEVSPNNLIALAHTCVPERSPVRVVEDGNPWVLLKDDVVRCKVMLRKERNSNLIHVVMSLKVCWGPPRKLPVALTVNCEDNPLSCLSVAEVLGHLYGDEKKPDDNGKIVAYTEVSEYDEFLIPVNYRRLEAKLANDQRLASIRPYPAFAVVGGYGYPGPPVLGDARALSGFMLQPRVYSPDEAEHVGWVVFDGSGNAEKEDFEVLVDLGSGPQRLLFRIPNVIL